MQEKFRMKHHKKNNVIHAYRTAVCVDMRKTPMEKKKTPDEINREAKEYMKIMKCKNGINSFPMVYIITKTIVG